MKKMIFSLSFIMIIGVVSGQTATKNDLPVKFEELTSPMFVKAVERSGGVCIIPMGILEKHGPHLPLGSDIFESRERALRAAGTEYAVVFPPYYFGQIFEARHQPGTISYSNELFWKLLEETCAELSRNGLKKIILVNGHGGNTNFVQFFCQSQLQKEKDYAVVFFQAGADQEADKEIRSLRKATLDSHAGERETSEMYFLRPDLVDLKALETESGLDQNKLGDLRNGYTGIWWYARYPNHFASDIATADKRLGELLITKDAKQLAGLIKYLKASNSVLEIQEEFYRRAADPLQGK